MTIDLSNLSQEKRAFLKVYPELLENLEKEIPKQVAGFKKREEKRRRGKAKWQHDLEDVDRRVEEARRKADKLRREYMLDPALREINRKFMDKVEAVAGKLICPQCGEGDKGNRMNDKPWCFKCQAVLVPKDKLEKWQKLPKIKVVDKNLKDELKRLNSGLNPDNEEE